MSRSYHAPVREQKARETRARIAAAARECFVESGFHGTSVAAIARRAGTTPQTLHAHFGGKAALVPALLEGMEDAAGAAQWRARVDAAPTGEARLAAWAGWTVAMLGPARTLRRVFEEAASEPALVELKAAGDRRRHEALTSLMGAMAQSGELRPGLAPDDAADQAWLLTGIEVYLGAVARGWSDERFAAWLGEALGRLLLR